MPTGKGLKRAIRRNGPDRSGQQYSAGGTACKQRPSSGKVPTRNNKYVLFEEREREQRRLQRMEAEAQSGRGSGPGPQWMPAAAAVRGGSSPVALTKKVESRLRMTRVDGFSSTVGTSPRNSKLIQKSTPLSREQELPLAERTCIPANQIIDVLQSLSSTLIFNTANSEERLALASRLRHWVVEDGTYLIREGDGDRNRSAIFMIASGKATISLNRANAGGSVQEVDIKDIKSPNYFGEGRVLGDSRAYASVRAKEELVVYYIMRADIEELVSPTTRALMERDMLVRKFQKENLDDLFAVIRKNLSGMKCLARFAEEQRMGGEVGFFMEVEEYRNAGTEGGDNDNDNDEARKMEHAERIVATYISPSASGVPGLIYTSEAQRKAVAAKMKRLWGKDRPKRRRLCSGSTSLNPGADSGGRENGEGSGAKDGYPIVVENGVPTSGGGGGRSGDGPAEPDRGRPLVDSRGDADGAGRNPSLNAGGDVEGRGGDGGVCVGLGGTGDDDRDGDRDGDGSGDDNWIGGHVPPETSSDKGGDGYSNGNANVNAVATGEMGLQRPQSAPQFRDNSSAMSARWSSSSSSGSSTCDDCDGGGGGGSGGGGRSAEEEGGGADPQPQGRQKADRRALSRSLFDEILDQNAIPTIRQNIVPKFIQSTYYELFLAELFPQVGVANASTTSTGGAGARVVHLVRGSMVVSDANSRDGERRGSAWGGQEGKEEEEEEEEVEVERGERCGTSSLEDVRDDPTALEAKISAAVEAARKVAAAAAAAAAAAVGVVAVGGESQQVRPTAAGASFTGARTASPRSSAEAAAASAAAAAGANTGHAHTSEEFVGVTDEPEGAGTKSITYGSLGESDYVDDDDEDFSDELLVVVGFRKGGLARRVSTGGLARIEEHAGRSCALM